VGELYTGTARFEKDEEVVLFLSKDLKGNFRVTGSNQGKFRVVKDERTGRKVIGKSRFLDDFKLRIKDIVEMQELE
jgi:hypothetical protein